MFCKNTDLKKLAKFKEKKSVLESLLKQEVGDDLGVCVLNIEKQRKSKSKDHGIKGSCNFVSVSHNPDQFGENRYCDKLNLMFLISHVTLHKHLLKW